jgi:hypothetical protein
MDDAAAFHRATGMIVGEGPARHALELTGQEKGARGY